MTSPLSPQRQPEDKDAALRPFLGALAFALLLTGCHLASSKDEQLAAARIAIEKAAVEGEALVGKPVIRTIQPGKGEGDMLLGAFCGTITDDGVAADAQKPRRFVYMAVDKDVVFETVTDDELPPTTNEERKLIAEAVKTFNDLWDGGCA
jgi:hypothetical protein